MESTCPTQLQNWLLKAFAKCQDPTYFQRHNRRHAYGVHDLFDGRIQSQKGTILLNTRQDSYLKYRLRLAKAQRDCSHSANHKAGADHKELVGLNQSSKRYTEPFTEMKVGLALLLRSPKATMIHYGTGITLQNSTMTLA